MAPAKWKRCSATTLSNNGGASRFPNPKCGHWSVPRSAQKRPQGGDYLGGTNLTTRLRPLFLATILGSLITETAMAASISREKLVEMFEQIEHGAKWDMTKPKLWGYFFTNPTRGPLEKAAELLVAKGYRLVDIHLGKKKATSDPDVWWLHVERIEVHSVDSLDARNRELEAFARDAGLANYDGMDVGPAN
jgi:predicted RNA-binding Zn-ribbon protein involved in translation (DUF1610 family)